MECTLRLEMLCLNHKDVLWPSSPRVCWELEIARVGSIYTTGIGKRSTVLFCLFFGCVACLHLHGRDNVKADETDCVLAVAFAL